MSGTCPEHVAGTRTGRLSDSLQHMPGVNGLHHVTAIAGPAQENLDFYAGILGMRLVKNSVNQDDPGTYHLFYADAAGHPGTDLTFFPWSHMAPSRVGHGLEHRGALAVPPGSLDFWGERLSGYGATSARRDAIRRARAAPRRSARPAASRSSRRRRHVDGGSRRGTAARCPRSGRCAACTAPGRGSAIRPRPPRSSRRAGLLPHASEGAGSASDPDALGERGSGDPASPAHLDIRRTPRRASRRLGRRQHPPPRVARRRRRARGRVRGAHRPRPARSRRR